MKTDYNEVCGAIVLLAKKLAASNRVMSIEKLSRKYDGHPYGGRGLIQATYRYAHAQRDKEAMNALTSVFTRDGLPVWYE